GVIALEDQSATGLLSASIIAPDGFSRAIPMQFDPGLGAYSGLFQAPADSDGKKALLVLQQANDVQRIPVGFPAAGAGGRSGSEDLDFGVNARLIRKILDETGGSDLERDEISLYQSPVAVRF